MRRSSTDLSRRLDHASSGPGANGSGGVPFSGATQAWKVLQPTKSVLSPRLNDRLVLGRRDGMSPESTRCTTVPLSAVGVCDS